MHHGNSVLDDLIGKPYQTGGFGNPGYDCLTLSVEVLKRVFGYVPNPEIFGLHKEFWEQRNKNLLFEKCQENLDLIWKGSYTDFNINRVWIYDVLVFKLFSRPTHIGVYIGNLEFISTSINSCVEIQSLNTPARIRTLHSVFRLPKET